MQRLQAGDPAAVGPYRVLARIGSGGMGTVFLATSPGSRLVALKVVRSDLGDDQEFRARFRREIAAARRVGGLYTAPVLGGDADAPCPWLAVGYVPAPTLAEAVAAIGPMPEAAVRSLGAGLAEALQGIHAAGLIHRDLKPGNVLLAEDGPKVIDFGITKAVESTRLTGTDDAIGTPAYMSPEQITADRELGPAADVFALAGVLVFAATGAGPFRTDDPASLLYQVMYGEPGLDGVPAPLRGLVGECLSKDPVDRPELSAVLAAFAPADPAALRTPALRREVAAREQAATAAANGPVVTPPPLPAIGAETAAGLSRRRLLGLAGAAGVGVVGVGGGVAWALTRDRPRRVTPVPRVTRLVKGPAPAWDVPVPDELTFGDDLSVTVAGGTVVAHNPYTGLCGIAPATGRRLWTLKCKTDVLSGTPYRAFGNTLYALSDTPTPELGEFGNRVHVIDPAGGSDRPVEMPADVTELTALYGVIGATVFVGALVHDAETTTVLAVDTRSGLVRWRFPVGNPTNDVFGVTDGSSLYLSTLTQVIGVTAATGVRRWARTWYRGKLSRAVTNPLVLGDGVLYMGSNSGLWAIRTRDGSVAWRRPERLRAYPILVTGSRVYTFAEEGFFGFDPATGALRWLRYGVKSSIGSMPEDTNQFGGSARLLAAAFSDFSSSSHDDKGFLAAATGGGPAWVHRGPTKNDNGDWKVAVSGTTVYATDNNRLYCFRTES